VTSLRVVLAFVGSALILSLAGIVFLSSTGHTIPDVLQNIAVGSLTGLVGLLKNTAEPTPPAG
jgi:hypothetical protein